MGSAPTREALIIMISTLGEEYRLLYVCMVGRMPLIDDGRGGQNENDIIPEAIVSSSNTQNLTGERRYSIPLI
jgi:hypothetical protein